MKVLKHLQEHKSITSWEAIEKYRITRLSARIYNLREKGYNIVSVYERNDLTDSNYVRYFLKQSKKD